MGRVRDLESCQRLWSGDTLRLCTLARYAQRLYLLADVQTLFPLAGLVDDLARAAAAHPVVLPAPLGLRLLPLPAIEARHRRALRPAVVAAAAAVEGGDEAMPAVEGVLPIEVNMLAAAVGVRLRSRAVADGRRVITARNLVEEFERRE